MFALVFAVGPAGFAFALQNLTTIFKVTVKLVLLRINVSLMHRQTSHEAFIAIFRLLFRVTFTKVAN